MKTYKGTTETDKNGGQVVYVLEDGHQKVLSPSPSQKVWNHSPCGFNHGYFGSGPAQLALALLLDVTGDKNLASRLHQSFKADVVATWPMDEPWEYSEAQLREWLSIQKTDGAAV